MKVMASTTSVVASTAAGLGAMPRWAIHSARPSEKAASPTMPLSMPMEVMPTCTVERNWVGWSCSSMAALAPLSPASAMAISRVLRLAANAISDMAKSALSRVNTAIKIKSMEDF